ncbi:MAG: FHA domain-containing protein [Gemmatimonadota bacterium]|nr:FHA domain-containing protein [Gemmatimonadota bacterium]
MPLLILGSDRCTLAPGSHTIGGRGPDALELTALEWRPAVASITVPVPGAGPCTIRRLTAAIVLRLDGELLGIASAELHNGATIEFEGIRLTYEADVTGSSMVHSAVEAGRDSDAGSRLVSGIGGRLVNTKTGQRFALTDRRVVIGRDDACDFVLGGKGVSRRHASISPSVNGYLLRDVSVNGTNVNDRALTGTHLLVHGDRIQLHDEELRYDVEGMADDAPAALDNDATQVLDFSHLRAERGSVSGRRISCSLEVMKGAFSGTTFELDKPVGSIGRARHNDVQLRDDSVSSAHATLLRKGEAWFVVDLRSANGTFVNGSRASGERELSTGALLRIGAVELVFRAFADGAPETPARPLKATAVQRIRSAIARLLGGRTV